ncbi:MAG: transposase domain-containing protein [Deltaproteobacteria bacterium]|nr:transposase domain-containing protein [Deltaproteobacteria bacterium]
MKHKDEAVAAVGARIEAWRRTRSKETGDADEKEVAEKKKRKGHGRPGSEDYTGAKKVKVALESLKAGDRCPECERGKLYVHPPSVLVRVTGIAPLAAIAYELETCELNDINPFDSLVAMLRHLADVEESPEDWLPWNYHLALAELDAIAATHD